MGRQYTLLSKVQHRLRIRFVNHVSKPMIPSNVQTKWDGLKVDNNVRSESTNTRKRCNLSSRWISEKVTKPNTLQSTNWATINIDYNQILWGDCQEITLGIKTLLEPPNIFTVEWKRVLIWLKTYYKVWLLSIKYFHCKTSRSTNNKRKMDHINQLHSFWTRW